MSNLDLARVADSRRQAELISRLQFSVWVGDTDQPSRAHAERLHAASKNPERTVYLVCNVKQHTLEVVTGANARQTLTDEECSMATDSMRGLLAEGRTTDALVLGLEHLSSYAVD